MNRSKTETAQRITIKSLIHILLVLVFLNTGVVYAAVKATVSKTSVAQGELFTLKVVSDQKLDSEDADFSLLKENFYLSAPRFSSRLNFINGKRSSRSEWVVSLAPVKTGTLVIPSLTIAGDNTREITIRSTANPAQPSQEDLLSFQAQLSKSTLYPQEVASLKTRLIIKTDVNRLRNANITPPIADKGVQLEAIGEPEQYTKIVNGVEVTLVDQEYSVSAEHSGSFTITGPSLSATVVASYNSSTSNSRSSNYLIPIDTDKQSIPLTVNAKPADYHGFWLPSTNLELKQTWLDENGDTIDDTTGLTTSVGSPITRVLTLTVEGATQTQLPDIDIDYPDSVRTYQQPAQFSQNGNQAEMVVKQVLIAKQAGDIQLPDVSLSWWNTQSDSAESARVKGLSYSVQPSDEPSLAVTTSQVATDTSAQKPTETVEAITVDDAGYWPYISAFFALLWLISSALWLIARKKLKAKRSSIANSQQPTDLAQEQQGANIAKGEPLQGVQALIAAVKRLDGVASQAQLDSWIVKQPNLDPSLVASMQAEMAAMMAHLYNSNNSLQGNNQEWDTTKLIKLIKQANKLANKPTKKGKTKADLNSNLAHL